MNKVMWVALREFVATVTTKGFILGVLVSPVLAAVMIIVMPMLINDKPPKVDGEVALVDPSGEILPQLRAYLKPEAIVERSDELLEQAMAAAPEGLRKLAATNSSSATTSQLMESIRGQVPEIQVNELQPGADLEQEKSMLHEGSTSDGGRLAIVVVHPDAVVKPAGAEAWGTYDLFVREKLDDRLEDEIKGGMRSALVVARARAQDLDPDEIWELTRVGRIRSRTVTAGGEEDTNEVLNILLPVGFLVLLFMAVLTGGQNLMTTVIEEKSSRVVEVLLSAVSPMQLMAGKILGQMVVGLVLMGVYAGMGMAAMISFAMLGLVDPWLFFYLLIFFVITYSVMGSLMAAIGAAVNQLREAQSLMMPVIMIMMLPWILWMPISRDPNSVFATVASFIPPMNTFVMLLRMTSTSPPPLWQVWLSILVGFASVYAALWVAAKVFRVGLLMTGKPPDFRTLVRWVRMA
jgi:ABC-2 type transport system permease protein